MENEFDNNVGATHSDAPTSNVDTRTEDQMLADIMRKSEFTPAESLTEEHGEIPAPEGTYEDDDQVPSVDDENLEVPDEQQVNTGDDTSTPGVYELDDLDDFSVNIKINGEITPVSLQELVKGYSTDQSLSQKGRELGDARKQLEAERESKLAEVDGVLGAASQILQKSEDKLAAEFHDIDSQITQAREDGDSYLVTELKDKKEVIQEKYWAARNEREEMIKAANSQKSEIENQKWNKQLETFSRDVTKVIPDWSEEIAGEIRSFVLDRGIPEEYLPQLADVKIVKFIDDFRRSENARTKGAVKRQAAPAKAAPPRKGVPLAQKREQQSLENRDKVLSGQGSTADNNAFLKNLAARHFDN